MSRTRAYSIEIMPVMAHIGLDMLFMESAHIVRARQAADGGSDVH